MKVEGQCHCGAITYEGEASPGNIFICNCADCQSLSGSAFRLNIAVPAASFRIHKGAPKKYLKNSEKGTQRIDAFCDICGGPVYSCAAQDPQSYSLRVGALRQRYNLGKPARQIWVKRRFVWLSSIAGTDESDGQS